MTETRRREQEGRHGVVALAYCNLHQWNGMAWLLRSMEQGSLERTKANERSEVKFLLPNLRPFFGVMPFILAFHPLSCEGELELR